MPVSETVKSMDAKIKKLVEKRSKLEEDIKKKHKQIEKVHDRIGFLEDRLAKRIEKKVEYHDSAKMVKAKRVPKAPPQPKKYVKKAGVVQTYMNKAKVVPVAPLMTIKPQNAMKKKGGIAPVGMRRATILPPVPIAPSNNNKKLQRKVARTVSKPEVVKVLAAPNTIKPIQVENVVIKKVPSIMSSKSVVKPIQVENIPKKKVSGSKTSKKLFVAKKIAIPIAKGKMIESNPRMILDLNERVKEPKIEPKPKKEKKFVGKGKGVVKNVIHK